MNEQELSNIVVEEQTKKIKALKTENILLRECLELSVGQFNNGEQCPVCGRWDYKELGHVSTCVMRELGYSDQESES